jgi:hypothetical protein
MDGETLERFMTIAVTTIGVALVILTLLFVYLFRKE